MSNKRAFVLLVGKDMGVCSELKIMLQKEYDVEVIFNGKEALDYMNTNAQKIDLVISETEVDVINGLELLRFMQISKTLSSIPLVMLIKEEQRELQEKVIEGGAADFITLPLSEVVILNRLRQITFVSMLPQYKNIMEDIVAEQIDKWIDTLGICKCKSCRFDLMALTLNRIKPKYVSSEKGRLISSTEKMSYNYVTEIVGIVAECAEMVKSHPRHPGT